MAFLTAVYVLIVSIVAKHAEIDIVEWADLNHAISKWHESRPFLIVNSPLSQWTLAQYLQQHSIEAGNKMLISYYEHKHEDSNEMDTKFSFLKAQIRSTNCHCFASHYDDDNDQVCSKYLQSFLYQAFGNRLSFWSQYEKNKQQIQQYEACTNISVIENMPMHAVINTLYSIDEEAVANPQQNVKRSIYVTGNIPLRMYRDMDVIQPFFNAFNITAEYGEWEIYIWMGSQNGSTSRHYDWTNNLFFVLRGRKQFVLSPPSLSQYEMYPALHSSWRQEILFQFDNDKEDDAETIDITVNENEVLYIPPLWYHKVRNRNTSTIGTNLWWYSQIHDRMDAMWRLSIPIEAEWSVYRKLDEIMYFVHNLLHRFNKSRPFVARNYFAIYPMLSELSEYRYCCKEDGGWKWLEWFVDVASFQYCYTLQSVDIFSLLQRTCYCMESAIPTPRWMQSVDSMEKVFANLNSDGMREVLLAELIEKLLLFVVDPQQEDASLVPLLISFSNI